jgi:hypothetical protein
MIKRFVLGFCLVLASSVAQAEPLPDLTIIDVGTGTNGVIWAHIKNIGQAASAPSVFYVSLYAFPGNPSMKTSFAAPHPGLAAGADQWVLIKTTYGLPQVKYNIRVNGNGLIKESNTLNNGKFGQFAYKP